MYTALIIEPRRHPALQFVLNNFLENLDERWDFLVFHGTENEQWLTDMIETNFIKDKARIRFVNLNINNLSLEEYNKFCSSEEFIKQIPTEIFLIFQTDTMICSSEKNIIYEFMNYDYVGAPWLKCEDDLPSIYSDKYKVGFNGKVGNGGISLRRKTKMLEVIKNVPYEDGMAEDGYFCVYNDIVNLNRPSYEDAQLFSMETTFSPRCFGLHKAWIYQEDHIEDIEKRFPGYNELIRLNSLPIQDQAIPPSSPP
jgi:hypothetical protein